MPKPQDNPSRDLELPPPNIDTPDEGSIDYLQLQHDSMIQHVGEDAWVEHWLDHFDQQAQGMQLQRIDQ